MKKIFFNKILDDGDEEFFEFKEKNIEIFEIGEMSRRDENYRPILDFVVKDQDLMLKNEFLEGETFNKLKSIPSEKIFQNFNFSSEMKKNENMKILDFLKKKMIFLEDLVEDLNSKLDNKTCQYEAKALALGDIAEQLNSQVEKNKFLQEKITKIEQNFENFMKSGKTQNQEDFNFSKKFDTKEKFFKTENFNGVDHDQEVTNHIIMGQSILTFDEDTSKKKFNSEQIPTEKKLQMSFLPLEIDPEKTEKKRTPANSENSIFSQKSQNSKISKKTQKSEISSFTSKKTQKVLNPESEIFDTTLEKKYKKLRKMPSLPPKITKLLSSLPIISYPTISTFYSKKAPFLGPFDYENICGKGQMKDGNLHGRGVNLWYSDKKFCYYVGEFKNGMRHGFGRMIYRNGKVSEGYWDNGIFIGENVVDS